MHDAKVESHPDLIRRGGAIVNTDTKEYTRALARRQQAKRLETLETTVVAMSDTINQMAAILLELQARK